jgi:hypothetical protein
MTTKVPPASPFRTSTARSLAPKRNRRLIRWATDCEVNLRIANPVPHSVNDTRCLSKISLQQHIREAGILGRPPVPRKVEPPRNIG